jgi:hypothetical protein
VSGFVGAGAGRAGAGSVTGVRAPDVGGAATGCTLGAWGTRAELAGFTVGLPLWIDGVASVVCAVLVGCVAAAFGGVGDSGAATVTGSVVGMLVVAAGVASVRHPTYMPSASTAEEANAIAIVRGRPSGTRDRAHAVEFVVAGRSAAAAGDAGSGFGVGTAGCVVASLRRTCSSEPRSWVSA